MYTNILDRLHTAVIDRDAADIARAIGTLITDDVIASGEKLPPIRSVAKALGVSTSTVAEAWTIMRSHGLIATDRRRGTTVRPHPGHGRNRYWRVPMTPGTLELDLSTGTPDPLLLPALEAILAKIRTDLDVTSYLDPPLLPELEIELRSRWPYDAPAMAIVDGANDGLDRVIRSTIRLGDTVIVEDPTYPLLLDLLDLAGANIIGVPLDSEGPCLEAIAVALGVQPAAMIIQTGAHNPTGTSVTRERALAIAELVRTTSMIVIEDDHAGDTADRAAVSLGCQLPEQVFRVHSFSKTHGPDLRIAALSGPVDGIQEIEHRRQLGPGWTSRLIQRILLEMLRSDEVEAQVQLAADEYRRRREALREALSSRGVEVGESHGLNLWVPVPREHAATVALAAQGVGVAPGEPFRVNAMSQHIRVTSAHVRDEFDHVASLIAQLSDRVSGR